MWKVVHCPHLFYYSCITIIILLPPSFRKHLFCECNLCWRFKLVCYICAPVSTRRSRRKICTSKLVTKSGQLRLSRNGNWQGDQDLPRAMSTRWAAKFRKFCRRSTCLFKITNTVVSIKMPDSDTSRGCGPSTWKSTIWKRNKNWLRWKLYRMVRVMSGKPGEKRVIYQ